MQPDQSAWPDLALRALEATTDTLQLWSQIVGKIRLAQTPWLNHSWHVTLYVSTRGLTTGPIPHGDKTFEMEFDFFVSQLVITTSAGGEGTVGLKPGSVAEFYREVCQALSALETPVAINETPNELPDPVTFSRDIAPRTYDPATALAYWRALVRIDHVFRHFRTRFLGKCSPVHLFWGAFDLAVTRFSGRRAPLHPGGIPHLPDSVTSEAYSHEVSSAGFWPGKGGHGPSFYAYAYPTPLGFAEAAVEPAAARFDPQLGEFLLAYDAVRSAADPDAVLTAFLQSTYEAAARLAQWDRASLECDEGQAGRPRIL